jgi:MatE
MLCDPFSSKLDPNFLGHWLNHVNGIYLLCLYAIREVQKVRILCFDLFLCYSIGANYVLNEITVVTWALMGVIWDVFIALTDGIGEAALVRVSFYLGEGMPIDARRLSRKILCIASILVLIVTSSFLMLGPRLAVLLTTDSTLQHLLNNLVGMAGLANVSVTAAQVYWSLAGGQGRFELASATILFCRWFIILPLAALMVFHFHFDPIAVAGSVSLGYATAAFVLAFNLFRSDWEELSRSILSQYCPRDGLYTESVYTDNIATAVVASACQDSSSSGDERDSCATSSYNESVVTSHIVV